jgi:hypothetical protein
MSQTRAKNQIIKAARHAHIKPIFQQEKYYLTKFLYSCVLFMKLAKQYTCQQNSKEKVRSFIEQFYLLF